MRTCGDEVAVDTNRLTGVFQGDTASAAFLGTRDEVRIPFVVPAEMKAGFYGGTRQGQNEALFARLMALETVSILLAERETTEQYARLFVQLMRAGRFDWVGRGRRWHLRRRSGKLHAANEIRATYAW